MRLMATAGRTSGASLIREDSTTTPPGSVVLSSCSDDLDRARMTMGAGALAGRGAMTAAKARSKLLT